MAVNDYATLTEIKQHLSNLGATLADGSQDALLTVLVTRASRAIDRYTNRKPGAYAVTADVTQYFDSPRNPGRSPVQAVAPGQTGDFTSVDWSPNRSLWVGELADYPTSVAVSPNGDLNNYQVWAATDYMCWPYNAPDYGEPFQRLDLDLLNGAQRTWYWYRRGIKIVGKFGYSQTPPDVIKEMTIIQAARWYKRGQVAWQDRTELTPGGTTLVDMDRVDKDLERLILNYRRINV